MGRRSEAQIREAIKSFPNDVWFTWDEVAAKLGLSNALGEGIIAVAQKMEDESMRDQRGRVFFLNDRSMKGQWMDGEE